MVLVSFIVLVTIAGASDWGNHGGNSRAPHHHE